MSEIKSQLNIGKKELNEAQIQSFDLSLNMMFIATNITTQIESRTLSNWALPFTF